MKVGARKTGSIKFENTKRFVRSEEFEDTRENKSDELHRKRTMDKSFKEILEYKSF